MPEKTINEIPVAQRELYEKGKAALQKNNLDYAVELFSAVLRQEPGFYPCREALRAAQVKRCGEKKSFFKRLVGSASALTKGQIALRNDPRLALEVAEETLNDDPYHQGAHDLLAEAALAMDFPKTAILSLEIAFRANPGNRKLAERLADTLQLLKQNNRSEKIYRDLLSMQPNDPTLNEKLKNLLASRTMSEGGYENLGEGRGSYRDIIRDKTEAVALEQEQRTVKDADVADKLIKDYEARLVNEPRDLRLMRQIAELHLQKKDFDGAIAGFERLLAASEMSDPTILRAILDAKVAKLDAAAAASDPTAPDDAERQASITREKSELLLADALKRSENNPSDLLVRYELGDLYLKAGRIGEAIAELQKAQNNPSRRIASMGLLARAFSARGMNDMASRKLQDALREKTVFDEEKKDLVYNYGVVLEKMGKREEAIEQFKQIYEQDISYRDVMARVDAYYASTG